MECRCTGACAVVVHRVWQIELPAVENVLAKPAPSSVEDTGEGDRSLYLFVFGQHHDQAHLELGRQGGCGLHVLKDLEQGW